MEQGQIPGHVRSCGKQGSDCKTLSGNLSFPVLSHKQAVIKLLSMSESYDPLTRRLMRHCFAHVNKQDPVSEPNPLSVSTTLEGEENTKID